MNKAFRIMLRVLAGALLAAAIGGALLLNDLSGLF